MKIEKLPEKANAVLEDEADAGHHWQSYQSEGEHKHKLLRPPAIRQTRRIVSPLRISHVASSFPLLRVFDQGDSVLTKDNDSPTKYDLHFFKEQSQIKNLI